MTTLADVTAEVERLEAIDADIGLGERGRDNLAQARKTKESLERQERRQRQEIKKAAIDAQSAFGADLTAAFEQLKAFTSAREQLMQSRQRVREAERIARAAGVEVDHSYVAFEIAFFDAPAWRALSNELGQIFGSGKFLG